MLPYLPLLHIEHVATIINETNCNQTESNRTEPFRSGYFVLLFVYLEIQVIVFFINLLNNIVVNEDYT